MVTVLRSTFANYVSDPTVRTTDKIPSNRVFLAQLYVAFELKDIPRPSTEALVEFYQQVYVEETRRMVSYNTIKLEPSNFTELFWDILNVDSVYYKPHIDKYVNNTPTGALNGSGGMAYKQLFHKLLQSNGLQPESNNNNPTTAAADIELKNISVDAELSPDEFIAKVKFNNLLGNFRGRFNDRCVFEIPYYEEFMNLEGLNGSGFFMSKPAATVMLLQNLLCKSNDKVKDAVSSKTYFNIMDTTNISKCIASILTNCVKDKVTSGCNSAMTKVALGAAALFAQTGDLEIAAGTLYGVKFGTDFYHFIHALEELNVTDAVNKVVMLTSGAYRGIKLVTGMPYYDGWYPGRRHARKMYENSADQADVTVWHQAFATATVLPFRAPN
jgi:hypothetical protein